MSSFLRGLAGAALKQSGVSPDVVNGGLALLNSLGPKDESTAAQIESGTEIMRFSQSQLKNLQKLNVKSPFACYKEAAQTHVVYELAGVVAGSSSDFQKAERVCDELNQLVKLCDQNEFTKLIDDFVLTWKNHRTWDSVHFAAYLGLPISLQRIVDQDSSKISLVTSDSGRTPLHLSADRGRSACAQFLLSKGADPSRGDVDQRNAVHLAALSNSKEVIGLLLKNNRTPFALKQFDSYGETPVDNAISYCDAEVVAAILRIIPAEMAISLMPLQKLKLSDDIERVASLVCRSPNYKPHDSLGNTLFHSPCGKQLILAVGSIPEVAVSVNAVNLAGQSPLHVAITRNDLSAVVALYAIGANLNLPDGDGNTALHYATKNDSTDLVKFLLCVGADVRGRNNKNELCTDVAKAHIRSEILHLIEQFSNPAYRTPKDSTKPLVLDELQLKAALEASKSKSADAVHLLSLDGGGVRGLVIIQILRHIEQRCPQLMKRIGWIAGTSTGAILALALSEKKPKTLKECQRLYFQLKDEIFRGKKPYSAQKLERLLKREYGEKTTMADLNQNVRVMVTAAKADQNPPTLTLFRNYRLCSKQEIDNEEGFIEPGSVEVWKAARCSSAAPMYFTSVNGMMDGGLVANNPACDLIADVQRCNLVKQIEGKKTTEVGSVISIGTGQMPPQPISEVNVSVPAGIIDGITSLFKNVQAVNNLKNILIEQVSAADGQCVMRARAMAQSLQVPFFRFSPKFSRVIDLDETNDSVIINMLWNTEMYMRTPWCSEWVEKLANHIGK